MELLQQFTAPYSKRGKHRRKCRSCGKLIQDGSRVTFKKYRLEKCYPVKGLMYFIRWHFWHEECHEEHANAAANLEAAALLDEPRR